MIVDWQYYLLRVLPKDEAVIDPSMHAIQAKKGTKDMRQHNTNYNNRNLVRYPICVE